MYMLFLYKPFCKKHNCRKEEWIFMKCVVQKADDSRKKSKYASERVIQWRLSNILPWKLPGIYVFFFFITHHADSVTDCLVHCKVGGCCFSHFVPDNVFSKPFLLITPPPQVITCSSLAILQTWLHMSLNDTCNSSFNVNQIVFNPISFVSNLIVPYLGRKNIRITVHLTLKHKWNRLLTMYNATGLMHELSDAMLMPK